MNKLIENQHLLFLLAIPVVLLTGYVNGESSMDICIHDTYFVISLYHISILTTALFAVVGLVYIILRKANKRPSKMLSSIHIGFTFIIPVIIHILEQFYREDVMEYEFNGILSSIITLLFLLVLLGQFIFPLNVLYAILKKDK